MTVEQRKKSRAEISLNVEIHKPGGDIKQARVVNLSENGAFIEIKAPVKVGEELDLVIFLDDKRLKVSPHARVIYSSLEGGKKESELKSIDEMRKWLGGKMRDGCGVMFTNMTEEDEKLLHAFVVAIKD